ncbi:MAG: DUF368 domain-containing protein [Acidobacteria bacterium]|nr:DUF368 domain-containing protein [Acidobacteriota bacterium]
MGAADIIPGVSGGTIALIMGIYESLLKAIKSIDDQFLGNLIRLRWPEAIAKSHLKFLIILGTGILCALFSLARVIHYFLDHHKTQTAALFLGLIAASIFFVAKLVPRWTAARLLAFLFGTLGAYWLVGLIPVQTPDELWFVFVCGVIAICAMILPGISGAFLLLILGKYAYLTAVLKNPFSWSNIQVIAVFSSGAAVGLAGFSRVLSYFLQRYHHVTMAVLTGLMAGSLRKIWPWKQVLESTMIRGKTYILSEKNIWPADYDQVFWVSCFLFCVGIVAVVMLERSASLDR